MRILLISIILISGCVSNEFGTEDNRKLHNFIIATRHDEIEKELSTLQSKKKVVYYRMQYIEDEFDSIENLNEYLHLVDLIHRLNTERRLIEAGDFKSLLEMYESDLPQGKP